MGVLIGFALLLCVGCGLLCLLLLLPLIVVGAVLKLLFHLVLLPFRLLGALFGAFGAAVSGIVTAGLSIVAGLAGIALLVAGLLVAPLIPLLLLGFGIWLWVRRARPRAVGAST